jgi:hypothetical protein
MADATPPKKQDSEDSGGEKSGRGNFQFVAYIMLFVVVCGLLYQMATAATRCSRSARRT